MNVLPQLEIGLLNGWLFFALYLVVFGITMKSCPPTVRRRLYDRSLWSRRTKLLTVIGKMFSLLNILMIIFGVLVLENIEFNAGSVLYLLGLVILIRGIIDYRDAPLNEPITVGLYKYSRNPQILGVFVAFLGMVLVIGSWINVVFLIIAVIFSHFSILGEEFSLEQQYGESYLQFKKKIPRYFLFF